VNDKRTNQAKAEFVFGGTFDPVHNGHLAILDALKQLSPDIPVRIIPCAIPPLKQSPKSSFIHRVAMLELATKSHKVIIDLRESQRQQASYTIDTLKSLMSESGDKNLILVIGMDSLGQWQQWHQWQLISHYCHLLVINRDSNGQVQDQNQKISQGIEQAGFKQISSFEDLIVTASGCGFYLEMPERSESSTQIRNLLDKDDAINTLVPQSVIEYIHQHHLYLRENH